jgi:glycerol-3-phosphate cytidylyltransferase-like family protein
MPTGSWEEVKAVHEVELQEHWALKTLWMNELIMRHVAIGEDEGREQGQWLELLMEDVLRRDRDLERQHKVLERHRLASLVQNSMEAHQDPPSTQFCKLIRCLCGRFEKRWSFGSNRCWASTSP